MSSTWKDLRKMYLTQENIAREAYFIWEREGRPWGNDWRYWFAAIEHLEMAAEMDAESISPVGRQIFCDATCGCQQEQVLVLEDEEEGNHRLPPKTVHQ